MSRPNQTTAGSVAATLVADPVDFEEMATEQNRCPETQRLLGNTSLKLAFRQTGAQRLAGDVSTGNFRPIVPLKFRKNIFDNFHNVAHPGRLASHRIISSRFVWRGLYRDVTAWARGCLACQWGKIHRHTRLVPLPIPIPQRRFSHLHVDLVAHCSTVIVLIILLPLLIARPSGWKPDPSFRNVCSSMRKSFNFYLDFSLWSARNNHFWSWAAIHCQSLVSTLQNV